MLEILRRSSGTCYYHLAEAGLGRLVDDFACWAYPRPVCGSDKRSNVDHRLFPAATTEFRVLPDAVSIMLRMLETSAVPAPLTDCRYTD
jgi:hypothetical protein